MTVCICSRIYNSVNLLESFLYQEERAMIERRMAQTGMKNLRAYIVKMAIDEEHRANITLHRAAKKHFDKLGLKKLPSIASLKQEYATLLAKKKKLYSGYRSEKSNMQELLVAKGNADRILGVKPNAQTQDISRPQKRSETHDL